MKLPIAIVFLVIPVSHAFAADDLTGYSENPDLYAALLDSQETSPTENVQTFAAAEEALKDMPGLTTNSNPMLFRIQAVPGSTDQTFDGVQTLSKLKPGTPLCVEHTLRVQGVIHSGGAQTTYEIQSIQSESSPPRQCV